MSKKDALAFLEKVEKDTKFKSEFAKAKTEADLKKMQEKYHLAFTKKEFQEAFQEKYHKKLTPQDLTNLLAAGGTGPSSGLFGMAASPDFFK